VRAAVVAADELVQCVDAELLANARGEGPEDITFRRLAHAYLAWLRDVRDAKPSTGRAYAYTLAEPGTPHRRGSRKATGDIMRHLGDKRAADGTTRDVDRMLGAVARRGVAARTVNFHRQMVRTTYGYGTRPSTFALPHNPATDADKRREPDRKTLDYYSVEEIEALARALAAGRHRDEVSHGRITEEDELFWRGYEDRQGGELVRVAAYTGLRRGEILALRWRDLDFAGSKVVASTAGCERDVGLMSNRTRDLR
jgi:integrase